MGRPDSSTKNTQKKPANKLVDAFILQKEDVLLKNNTKKSKAVIAKLDATKVIGQLKQQQRELEIQNKALMLAKSVALQTAEKFTELYDFAPSGYFTLSAEGKVIELNFCGSQMLGKKKSYLKNSQFLFFVSNDTKSVFLNFLKKIFKNRAKETCELVLPGSGNLPIHVHLTGIAAEKGKRCLVTAVDITDSDLINEGVLERGHRYQVLTEVAPVGIFHTDATGYTTYVNPSWCQITGLSDEEALGNNWLKAVHEEDKKILYRGWQKAVRTKKISISEYRFNRSDGSIAWVMGQAIPEKNLDNEILGYVGTITDITERKKIEEKQLEAQDFLKETQTIANMGTYIWDSSSGLWSSSEIMDSIFGIGPDYSRTTESMLNIVHPNWRQMIEQYFNEIILTKANFDKEYKIIRINDKAERWVQGVGRFKINDKNGSLIMVGTIQDITNRKIMEIELIKAKERAEESNSKFRNYVENAPDGVIVADEEGNFLEVNPAAAFITGYSKEELLAMSIKDIAAPETLDASISQLHILLQTGSSKEDAKFMHKNGNIGWLSVEAVKLSANRVIGFVKDITKRKQTEVDIKKSNERFELLAKATNDGLWDWSIEHDDVWANQIHQKLYGLSVADPVPDFETWKQRIHPDDRENTIKVFEQALASGKESYSEEYRFYAEDAGWIYVYGRTLIERNKEGTPIRIIGSMTNITERKKAAEELLSSKQQFQNLIENIPGVYWINNLETYQTLYISPSYETIWGRKCEDLINNPADFINAIHPDDKPVLFEAHQNIVTTLVNSLSYRIVRPDGEIRWISAKTNVVTNYMGNKIEYGYAEDITERKKAEEAIKVSEEKYRTLVEQASDAILIVDEKGKFITVNSSVYKMSKYTEEELSKMSIYDFFIPEEIKQRPLDFDELIQGKSVISERSIKIKDGTVMHIEITAKLLSGNRLLAFVRDTSERKKAERALAESENRLRTIVQSEPECIKLLNINGEMEDINPAGLDMIEADTIEQVQGHSVLDVINKPYKKAFKKIIKEGFNGKSGIIEYQITGYKGSVRWVDTHAVPLKNQEGKIVSLLCVTRNMTKSKKAQEEINNTAEQLRQLTAHLQSVREEERKRIGREIHDELGQQLTAIKMDVVWIDKKIPEETTALKNKLKNIIGLLDGSNQSIRRILSELRPVILDDHGLLEAMEWLGNQFTANTGIIVKFDCSETEIKSSEQITTCIFRVYQEAFTNITRHACAKLVATSLSIEDDTIVVTVKDDGKGFDTESVQNKKSFGIFGMKERVLSLGGKFDLFSSTGKGTKIIMILPYTN